MSSRVEIMNLLLGLLPLSRRTKHFTIGPEYRSTKLWDSRHHETSTVVDTDHLRRQGSPFPTSSMDSGLLYWDIEDLYVPPCNVPCSLD